MAIPVFMQAVVGRRRLLPDAEDVTTRLKQLDEILTELTTTPEIATASAGFEVKGLRNAVDDIKKRLPLKPDGTMDESVWGDDKTWPADKKRSIYWDLGRIWKGARGINASELTVGRWYFATFLALFIIVAGVYLCWYRQPPGAAPAPADVVELHRLLNTTETRLKEFRSPDAKAKEAAKDSLTALAPQLRAEVLKMRLAYHSLQRLGVVESDIETERIATSRSFEDFRDHIRGELARLTASRWPYVSQQWLEVAWWAEFGTLVGILFYISGVLSNGVFRVEEIATFWSEVAIAPVVIPAVFFLSQFVGLTTNPTQATTTVTLGVAFLLGFSIRRTVGLLDLAKKKILPDPDTSPTPVKVATGAPQKVPTVTMVTASAPKPTAAAPATFTITVKPTTANAGVPTGTVSLKRNGIVVDPALVLDAQGTATATPPLPADKYTISAEYAGDATFALSKGELAHEVT